MTTTTTSVEKALDLLHALGRAGGAASLAGLAGAANMPKSSAHRLLQSLLSRGMVARSEEGEYRLGLALITLGDVARSGSPLLQASHKALRAAVSATGESCFLVVATHGKLRVALLEQGSGFLRAMPAVGAEVPVHASASGRLYLAFDPEQVRLAQRESWERFTERTPVASEELTRRVDAARARGFDSNVGEWMPDVAVVAAPVRARARLLATVAMATPLSSYERLGCERLAEAVCGAAAAIEEGLELASLPGSSGAPAHMETRR